MKFSKITIHAGALRQECLKTFTHQRICTANMERQCHGDNYLCILDDVAQTIIMRISDIRMEAICGDCMFFVGYLTSKVGKFKESTKVYVTVWN